MKPIKFYRLRTLIERYGIKLTGGHAGKCGHVTADGKPGVLYGSGGSGICIDDYEKFMDEPCRIYDFDIGYSDIRIEKSMWEVLQRHGYEVEIV